MASASILFASTSLSRLPDLPTTKPAPKVPDDPWLCYLCNRRLSCKGSVTRHLGEVHGLQREDIAGWRIKRLSERRAELMNFDTTSMWTTNTPQALEPITWGVVDDRRAIHGRELSEGLVNRRMGNAVACANVEVRRMRDGLTTTNRPPIDTAAVAAAAVQNLQDIRALGYGGGEMVIPEKKEVLAVVAQAALEVLEGVEMAIMRRNRDQARVMGT